MSDFFYRRFQSKTNDQLRAILDERSRYQDNAIDAAIRILNERNDTDIEIDTGRRADHVKSKGLFEQIFSTGIISRTFGYEDILNWITITLLCLASFEVLSYYSDEPFIEHGIQWIVISILLMAVLSNHILFRSTHSCTNNFLGRIIHDLVLCFLLVSFREIYYYIVNGYGTISLNTIPQLFSAVIFLSFFIEIIVAILRRFFLTVFNWRPL